MNQLSTALSQIVVGQPQGGDPIAVFPLIGPEADTVYLLLEDALKGDLVTVEEVSGSGSVPELLVTNESDCMVLIVEGDELTGAKQNRIVNTTMLLHARSKTIVPVSCCEAGRWRMASPFADSPGTRSPHSLRMTLSRSVHASLRTGMGHRSDQSAMWKGIGDLLDRHGVSSPTSAMHDVWIRRQKELDDLIGQFTPLAGQTGLAVIGSGQICVDLFDRPNTLARLHRRLLCAFALDASTAASSGAHRADSKTINGILQRVGELPLERFDAVGIGHNLRFASKDLAGSALVLDGVTVHLAVHSA
jgi:hypothetical protein